MKNCQELNMNITRLNFKQTLPLILEKIQAANFIALDLEMSGIISIPEVNPSMTDSMQIRYEKTKFGIQKYVPLQLGICCVEVMPKKIIYSPFNMYIYPLSLSESDPEIFSFNSSSLMFLANNSFDFNKLLYEGIPYINKTKASSLKDKEQIKEIKKQFIKIALEKSPDVQAFYKNKIHDFQQWVSQDVEPLDINIQYVRVKVYEHFISTIRKMHPSLNLSVEYLDFNLNCLEENAIYQRKFMRISKVIEQINQPKESRVKQEPFFINDCFSQIIRLEKPLIFHNGYLDLMHIYNRFIGNLPPTQQEYKQLLQKNFPFIYDTKFICNNNIFLFNKLFKETSLSNCFKGLRDREEEGESQIDKRFSEYSFDGQAAHEAGFDALMTANTFINAMKLLGKKNIILEHMQELPYYSNKIPLGAIKLPFNLKQTQNLYESSTKTIHLVCLTKQFNLQNFKNQLMKRYGSLHLRQKEKGAYSFTLRIINKEKENSFIADWTDSTGFGIYSLEDSRLLVKIDLTQYDL